MRLDGFVALDLHVALAIGARLQDLFLEEPLQLAAPTEGARDDHRPGHSDGGHALEKGRYAVGVLVYSPDGVQVAHGLGQRPLGRIQVHVVLHPRAVQIPATLPGLFPVCVAGFERVGDDRARELRDRLPRGAEAVGLALDVKEGGQVLEGRHDLQRPGELRLHDRQQGELGQRAVVVERLEGASGFLRRHAQPRLLQPSGLRGLCLPLEQLKQVSEPHAGVVVEGRLLHP